ncbi:hypothetical protein [Halobacteriovorax sp. CON-3]|uniref:hypothetical protein n=1 Tax=Halobacteriovorax sp. CON-3 TaxID=3157710 RepID=UPI00372230E7
MSTTQTGNEYPEAMIKKKNELPRSLNQEFCNKQAKLALSKVFYRIFPDKLSLAVAQKVTGVNRSNIHRAKEGKTLLGAEAICKIIMKAYGLKFVSDTQQYLESDADLVTYISNEIGEEFWNKSYISDKLTPNLLSAINDADAQILYAYLYTKESASYDLIIGMFGESKAEKLIHSFEINNIVDNRRDIGHIVFNKSAISNNLTFRKQQMSISLNSISELDIRNGRGIYYYDNIVTSKEIAKEGNELILRQAKEQAEFVRKAESVDKSKKDEVMSFGIYSVKQKIPLLQKENLQ